MLVTFFFLQLDLLIGSYRCVPSPPGSHKPFSILALATGPALILAFFLYLFLPETKDKTNAEVGLSQANQTQLQVQALLSESVFSGFKKKKRKAVVYGAC